MQGPLPIPRPIRDLPLFWKVQISAWAVFTVLSIPLKAVFYQSLGYAMLLSFCREPFGLLLTSGFRVLYRRMKLRADQPLRVLLWIFPVSFAAAAIDLLIGLLVAWLAGRAVADEPLFGPYLFRTLLFLLWSVLYLGIKGLIDARERLLNLSRAETAARDAEILMLRAQVSPHFLFNAFNTILADLDGGNPGLVPVVRGLSDYFRYSLAHRDEVFVSMGEEYDAILSYLTVEKARFQDSLEIDCHLDPGLRDMAVPGIFLQPLVENALKYGHLTSPTPLRLKLHVTTAADGGAIIEVTNSGRWIEAPATRSGRDPGGNGLSLTRRRLELLYPGNHSLEIQPDPPRDEVRVRIHLTHPSPVHA